MRHKTANATSNAKRKRSPYIFATAHVFLILTFLMLISVARARPASGTRTESNAQIHAHARTQTETHTPAVAWTKPVARTKPATRSQVQTATHTPSANEAHMRTPQKTPNQTVLAQVTQKTVLAQNQTTSSVTNRSAGPALVRPPDVLTDESDGLDTLTGDLDTPTGGSNVESELSNSVEAELPSAQVPSSTSSTQTSSRSSSKRTAPPASKRTAPPASKRTAPPARVSEDILTDGNFSIDDPSSYETNQEPIPQIRRKKPPVKNQTGTYYIEHPNAKRGLIKIDKDRVYHYKVKNSEQKNAGSFRIGTYTPSHLTNPNNSALTFDNIYDETNFPILLYDHEWQFFQKLGKLSWKLGGGFYLAQGKGQFENINGDPSARPREQFTLFVFPLNIGLTYRLHYWKNQWVVPYIEGGADGFLFAEYRDDDQNPTLGAALGAAPAVHYSVGGSISLGKDARSFLDLDREYGINAVFFTVEYRQYFALSDKYDFSGDAITGGVTAEF